MDSTVSQARTAFEEQAHQSELERAVRLLRRGQDPARVVEAMSRRLINKLLHWPTKALQGELQTLCASQGMPTRAPGPPRGLV